ncbi:Hypothetical Protein FCC1311_095182 [Hondaea fermentalgiana]|uniref:Uncharacterized protein n=1 Tax=Hondaea fermentalgiana TaxID=2315210 RepID=A0A2R5GZ47_9STRA|nr:Hypothetical Protein FCC1311_095182 [Hondaea fermentalgiana]|eukprot:GBG33294.1 Hypothetical Protein FCC1311_095182 [Hondaea fermentalgiana]
MPIIINGEIVPDDVSASNFFGNGNGVGTTPSGAQGMQGMQGMPSMPSGPDGIFTPLSRQIGIEGREFLIPSIFGMPEQRFPQIVALIAVVLAVVAGWHIGLGFFGLYLAPQPSGRVEVKAPPFVCRGRQFVLHEPPMDEDQRQRIRSAIRNRMIGDALAKVRQHDEDYVRASRAKSVLATKALLERQELELAARLRNLEQQKDTLKLLLEQIEHEGDGDDAMEGDAVES